MKPEEKNDKFEQVMSHLDLLTDDKLVWLGDEMTVIIQRWMARLHKVSDEVNRRKHDRRAKGDEAAGREI